MALWKVSPRAMARNEVPTLIAHHAIQTIRHSVQEGSIERAFSRGQCTEIAHCSPEFVNNAPISSFSRQKRTLTVHFWKRSQPAGLGEPLNN